MKDGAQGKIVLNNIQHRTLQAMRDLESAPVGEIIKISGTGRSLKPFRALEELGLIVCDTPGQTGANRFHISPRGVEYLSSRPGARMLKEKKKRASDEPKTPKKREAFPRVLKTDTPKPLSADLEEQALRLVEFVEKDPSVPVHVGDARRATDVTKNVVDVAETQGLIRCYRQEAERRARYPWVVMLVIPGSKAEEQFTGEDLVIQTRRAYHPGVLPPRLEKEVLDDMVRRANGEKPKMQLQQKLQPKPKKQAPPPPPPTPAAPKPKPVPKPAPPAVREPSQIQPAQTGGLSKQLTHAARSLVRLAAKVEEVEEAADRKYEEHDGKIGLLLALDKLDEILARTVVHDNMQHNYREMIIEPICRVRKLLALEKK